MNLYDRFVYMNPWTRIIVCLIFGGLVQHSWSMVRSRYQAPRSTCLIQDETHSICRVWNLYSLHKLKNGENGDVAGHADQCLQSGGRVEHGAVTRDGGLVLTCLHD
jgi:hypothetical protein